MEEEVKGEEEAKGQKTNELSAKNSQRRIH